MTDRRGRLRGRLPSAALIALGLAALYEASSLPFGTVRQPDTAFFPSLVSLALVCFAALATVRGDEPEGFEVPAESGGQSRAWAVIVAVAVYAGLLAPVGFLICTAALLLLLLRAIGRASWTASTVGAAAGSVCCYALFTRMGMPLPDGLLGF